MANAGTSSVKIIDNDSDVVTVTSNRLDVNAYLNTTPTIDIGDVSLLLGGTAASVNNGAADATTLRVTVASDSTGVLSIDDNGGSITVDGTVSVNSHAVTNAGTFATQIDGNALTALQLIDDVVYTDDSTEFTLGSSKGVMMMGFAGAQSVGVNDVAALRCNTAGALYTRAEIASYGNPTSFYQQDTDSYNAANIGPAVKVVRSNSLAALNSVDDGDWTSLQVNAAGALYVEVATSTALTVDLGSDNDVTVTSGAITASHDITGGADGVKTVSNAGTAEALSISIACKKVDIQAQTDNTGLIAVGFTGVDATEATGTGIILRAGDTYSLEIDNLNDIYIDATVSGEGVRYTYFT